MQIIFAAEILVIRLAKTYIIQRSILTSFKRWLPDKQIICKASRQQNHTASGIVSNKKVMKAARDQQLDFCSSFGCNKRFLFIFSSIQSHVFAVVHCSGL